MGRGDTGLMVLRVALTPRPVQRRRCRECGHWARIDRMIDGAGSDCAERLELAVSTPRVRADPQTGPGLFDAAADQGADTPDDTTNRRQTRPPPRKL
jgi:hypothetical protein